MPKLTRATEAIQKILELTADLESENEALIQLARHALRVRQSNSVEWMREMVPLVNAVLQVKRLEERCTYDGVRLKFEKEKCDCVWHRLVAGSADQPHPGRCPVCGGIWKTAEAHRKEGVLAAGRKDDAD